MNQLVMIVLFLPTIVLGHSVLEDAEVQKWCPTKCKCGVTEKEGTIADCSNRNYTSIPPYFPKLNSLNFSCNQISEVSNINFMHESFRNIQSIDLSNNEIRNIETESFKHVTQLYYLDLSSNKIGSVAPESFKELKNLKILDLRGNSIDCTALQNELTGIRILCGSSEEYAYGTTTATATLTKATDSNMEIPKVSYTDDTTVKTVTETNMNDIEMHITTSTKNYNSSAFEVTQITHGVAEVTHITHGVAEVTQITHGVAADQQPSTVPAINEETGAAPIVIIISIILILLVIVVYGGVFVWRRKRKYTKVQTDLEEARGDAVG